VTPPFKFYASNAQTMQSSQVQW